MIEQKLLQCRGASFNVAKANRILKSHAGDLIKKQIAYLRSRQDFQESWIPKVHIETIASLIGLLPIDGVNAIPYLREQLEGLQHIVPPPQKRPRRKAKEQSLKAEFDALVARLNTTQEELGRRMGLTKTTYYSVRAGGGKETSRLKALQFLEANKNKQ